MIQEGVFLIQIQSYKSFITHVFCPESDNFCYYLVPKIANPGFRKRWAMGRYFLNEKPGRRPVSHAGPARAIHLQRIGLY